VTKLIKPIALSIPQAVASFDSNSDDYKNFSVASSDCLLPSSQMP